MMVLDFTRVLLMGIIATFIVVSAIAASFLGVIIYGFLIMTEYILETQPGRKWEESKILIGIYLTCYSELHKQCGEMNPPRRTK